jgi:hypothetical protein
MGRPLTGKVDHIGDAWVASVPKRRGQNKRVQCTFRDETAAQQWVAKQLRRLNAGLDAEPAATDGGVRNRPAVKARPQAIVPAAGAPVPLEPIARRWHAEQYDALHRGDADRTRDVLADLERHILPAFPVLPVDVETFRAELTDWVRVMAGYDPKDPSSPFQTGGRTYSRRTVTGLLWILTQALNYASILGHDVPMRGSVPAATAGIRALAKRGVPNRVPRLVPLELTARIAAEMHVIHQTVLWLLRLAGLRIGEAFGLIVANFLDDGEHAYLVVEAQGGGALRFRDDDENVRTTRRKKRGKTEADFRVIALPEQLAELIRTVISVFHTSADGTVDYGARLVPAIQKEAGGKQGFYSALRAAVRAIGEGSTNVDDYVAPHDLRKNYCSDLAWTPELDALVRRRTVGHRAGTDVFDVVYTLDRHRFSDIRPAAVALEREITQSTATLMIATTRRAHCTAYALEDRARFDARLRQCEWLVGAEDGYVTATEAAEHLGMAVTSTRRLLDAGHIPAVRGDTGWLARLDDVIAFRDRHAGHRTIGDVADEAGVDYHTVYRAIDRLGITPATDVRTRSRLLSGEDVSALTAELDRLAALHERALPVADAAAALTTGHSTVHKWAAEGRLTYDAESDASGRRFITRASVDAELARRRPARTATITVQELSRLSGLGEAAIGTLIRAGHFVRHGRARDGRLRVDSVKTWATGYRPDLLAAFD